MSPLKSPGACYFGRLAVAQQTKTFSNRPLDGRLVAGYVTESPSLIANFQAVLNWEIVGNFIMWGVKQFHVHIWFVHPDGHATCRTG